MIPSPRPSCASVGSSGSGGRSLRVASVLLLIAVLGSSLASSAELTVEFELPTIDTADYNRPYVAIWSESPEGSTTLLLWHLDKRKEDKWLSDIRRWWRKQGRYGRPVDAVTGATRGPGRYRETFTLDSESPFTLFLEVVREDGGRSLLKQPIDFTNTQRVYTLPADREIGVTTISLGDN